MLFGPKFEILVPAFMDFFAGTPPETPEDGSDEHDQEKLVGFEAVALWGEKQQ